MYGFYMILISLNSIPIGHCKEMCIFCAVGTKPFNIILLNFSFQKVKTAEASLPSFKWAFFMLCIQSLRSLVYIMPNLKYVQF